MTARARYHRIGQDLLLTDVGVAIMSLFRRFVVAMVEFFQVIFIVIATVGGARAGYLIVQIYNAGPYATRPTMFIDIGLGPMPASEVVGIAAGGVVGFVTTATAAALIFLLVEIMKNTRRTAEL